MLIEIIMLHINLNKINYDNLSLVIIKLIMLQIIIFN